jgi:hypothetical protein
LMTTTPSVLANEPAGSTNPFRVPLVIAPLVLASLTSTWPILKPLPGPLALSDYLLALSLLITMPLIVARSLPLAIPQWMLIPGVVIPLCVLVGQIDPSPSWRAHRQQVQQLHPDSFTRALIWLAVLYIVPMAIIAGALIDRRAVEWVMGAYVAGVAVSSAIAISDLLGRTHIAENLAYNGFGKNTVYAWDGQRFSGLEDHPNHLGLSILISLPFVIYFMHKVRRRWIPGIALLVLAGGLLASGSRGSQALSVLVVLGAVLCLPRKREIARIIAGSALAAAGIGVVLLFTVLSEERSRLLRFTGTGAESARSGDAERWAFLRQGWLDWQMYPWFGAGLRHINEAHNIYVQLLAAGGIVLALSMMTYFALVIRDCWRLSCYGNDFARFLLLSIATWLTYGVILDQLTDRELYFTIGCVAALVVTTTLSKSSASTGRTVDDSLTACDRLNVKAKSH